MSFPSSDCSAHFFLPVGSYNKQRIGYGEKLNCCTVVSFFNQEKKNSLQSIILYLGLLTSLIVHHGWWWKQAKANGKVWDTSPMAFIYCG